MSNIIKNATYNYDYLNPLKGDNPDWDYIPGFRGADQLNIYTYDYLISTSKTWNITPTRAISL